MAAGSEDIVAWSHTWHAVYCHTRGFKQGVLSLAGVGDPLLDAKIEAIGPTWPKCIETRSVDLGMAQLLVSFKDVDAGFLVTDVSFLFAQYCKNPPPSTSRQCSTTIRFVLAKLCSGQARPDSACAYDDRANSRFPHGFTPKLASCVLIAQS